MYFKNVKTALFALVTACGLGSGVASATPITDWTYSVSAAFDTVANAPTFSSTGGCQSITGGAISWGACGVGTPPVNSGDVSTSRSGIGITNSPATGTIQTNGAAQNVNTYTHYNNPISGAFGTLQTATVNASLTLSSLLPTTGINFGPATVDYHINFLETPNTTPCVVTTSPIPCNDIFVIAGLLNNSFSLDGETYYVSFFEAASALNPLPSDVCASVGVGAGCLGFTTVEGQANAFTFALMITSQPVTVNIPEPSSLALLGLGLLAAVGVRRRTVQRT